MYIKQTKDDWLMKLGLQNDYKVDGFLAYGTYNRDKHLQFFKDSLDKLGKNYTLTNLEDPFFSKVTVLNIEGKNYWFDIAYGGAFLSELIHVASMLGSKKNILLGTCGGLKSGAKSGDMIVPEYSYGDESSTRMYARKVLDNRHYSDRILNEKIISLIDKEFKYYTDPIITCQAMLGETEEDVRQWSKEGYAGVEMESATVFAVSKYFNVPSCAILYITDNLIEGEIVDSDSHKASREYREKVRIHKYDIAIKVLLEK